MHAIVTKTFHTGATLAAAAALLAATAQAETIALAKARANNFTGTSTSGVAVPLDAGGHTSLAFNTTKANQLVRVIYNAECGVLGPAQAWMSVSVMVDGTQANPASGTSFALCTATDVTNYSWVGATRQSFLTVPTAGSHSIQIIASGQNGATQWWLGDTAIVVDAN